MYQQKNGFEWVYMVRCGRYFKVGHTWNLSSRLASLPKLDGHEPELLEGRFLPHRHARYVEKLLRLRFTDYLVAGHGREVFYWRRGAREATCAVMHSRLAMLIGHVLRHQVW